ncbi:LysR family transcriptional regulator [Yoonia sp. 208BN28-4]|uniref:LysR family transcriptional regulator n=1 Tax=Yoonia sp. 208BN28-4 TaxID=3126505 RepID=UPI0030A2B917
MDNWDEIRTAFQVARNGTVSGAADVLGVHHATVIRHIDALEERLGVKLFQRHARGYTATEAGNDLLRVAQTTDEQFSQLASRIKGQGAGVSGELTITTLAAFSSLLMPVIAGLQADYPALRIRYLTGERLFRLEYGEAHVAIRGGAAPDEPDNVVQALATPQMHLVAAESYVAQHGLPKDDADLVNHSFIGTDDPQSRAPWNSWITQLVPSDRIVFRADETAVMAEAVIAGAGIGFLPSWIIKDGNFHEVTEARAEWRTPMWLVTHVDLHRTDKVQAALKAIKQAAKAWDA